jgi:hypothetical protein
MAPPTKYMMLEEASKLRALLRSSEVTRTMLLTAFKSFEHQLREHDEEVFEMKRRLEEVESRLEGLGRRKPQ